MGNGIRQGFAGLGMQAIGPERADAPMVEPGTLHGVVRFGSETRQSSTNKVAALNNRNQDPEPPERHETAHRKICKNYFLQNSAYRN